MLLIACITLSAPGFSAAAMLSSDDSSGAVTSIGTEPGASAEAASATSKRAVEAVEGLWAYTNLTTSSGVEMPLTGVILFKDGHFAQQSIFNGEPFEEQGVMAHAGTYAAGPRGVHLVAEQTISISPEKDSPLTFRRDTQHDISVDRSADDMTLVFASGTVQEFERMGPASGKLYRLEQGLLAFVDGHFVLVSGDESATVSGYGSFERDGTRYRLHPTRWAEAKGATAANRRNVTIEASFDGRALTLEDGRRFRVVN